MINAMNTAHPIGILFNIQLDKRQYQEECGIQNAHDPREVECHNENGRAKGKKDGKEYETK